MGVNLSDSICPDEQLTYTQYISIIAQAAGRVQPFIRLPTRLVKYVVLMVKHLLSIHKVPLSLHVPGYWKETNFYVARSHRGKNEST